MAGGPGGRICGIIVVLVNVKAWKREKMVYGKRATNLVMLDIVIARDVQGNILATGFEDHQNIASKKY